MPLNHLGLVVRYVDVSLGLPSISQLDDVRGVLTWWQSDSMADPLAYLSWAEAVIDAGKRFVILGDPGFTKDLENRTTPRSATNHFLAKLGLRARDEWRHITYDVEIAFSDPLMVEFERRLDGVLPPFDGMTIIDRRATSYLVVRRGADPATDSHLVVIAPTGAYVAPGYVYSGSTSEWIQWYINPIEFFRLAFGADEFPRPDTTTESGRRIFYSHVDGDGWRNVSAVTRTRARRLSAEVILDEVIEAFPDLPVTVAPVVADLDPDWLGSREALRVARSLFALPHVEAGSHTYSHPLNWEAFAQGGAADEQGLLRRAFRKTFPPTGGALDGGGSTAPGYDAPRSYPLRAFSLTEEIEGSIAFINTLLPEGKQVEVLQWSGDTTPFEAAVTATRAAGVRNINGGDTRFDQEFPSYAWVSPLGRQVGRQRQIYSSNSNENTYTDLWTDRFFGFQHLLTTIRNTEIPVRIKPFNVYYHMYSGEKLSSLNAVLSNLRFARTQEITPITTSNYAAVVDGFYSARITRVGEHRWRIEDRDALQTVRFDRATFRTVDFARSKGVVGQRHYQGSLYVALDAEDPAPVVALRDLVLSDEIPRADQPYLIHARYQVWNLRHDEDGFSFSARGFGRGDMLWRVSRPGSVRIQITHGQGLNEQLEATVDRDGILAFEVGSGALKPIEIVVTHRNRSL